MLGGVGGAPEQSGPYPDLWFGEVQQGWPKLSIRYRHRCDFPIESVPQSILSTSRS